MITDEKVIMLRCDSCGTLAPLTKVDIDGDPDAEPAWWWPHQWAGVQKNLAQIVEPNGWTHNGEGIIHCPGCPILELTQEAKEERLRDLERTGLTLFDLEGTTL